MAIVVKNPSANAGDIRDASSVPGLEDALEEGMAIHSSILSWRIPMDRGAWWATVYGVTKSRTRLSDFHFHFHSRVNGCTKEKIETGNISSNLQTGRHKRRYNFLFELKYSWFGLPWWLRW